VQSNSNNVGIPIAIIVTGIMVSAGLYFGLQGRVADGSVAGTNTQPTTANNQPLPTEAPSIVDVSIDNSPVKGDADAPVTVIEFSDYECPYCKRSYQEMLPQLYEEYVDTGVVKFVFRDLPLYFHDPAATTNAIAAHCARDQGDDDTYFAYHDLIFDNTALNGQGVGEGKLTELATSLGLNADEFDKCMEDGDFADVVASNLAYAQTVGANGTPTYFVGKSTPNGVIKGEIVVGAVPYATMKTVIEKYR
jgi:protein-disulfide isomerase